MDIFVDSPLATEITSVYRRHADLLPPHVTEAEAFLGGPHVHYIRDRDESLALAERTTPYILVASGGMCDAGRILHHLKRPSTTRGPASSWSATRPPPRSAIGSWNRPDDPFLGRGRGTNGPTCMI